MAYFVFANTAKAHNLAEIEPNIVSEAVPAQFATVPSFKQDKQIKLTFKEKLKIFRKVLIYC